MLDALPPDARALLALAALVGVPGILVVRAPWRAVPLLSVAFWILSWLWFVGSSRARFLQATLVASVALASFRLLRAGRPRRPRPEHAVLAAGALAVLLLLARWPVAPGPRMPLESLAALILAWNDGWPASFAPFLDVRPFQASGVAMLGADVTLLCGAPAYRATLLATLAGQAALLVALWWLATPSLAPLPAATLALALTLAAAPPETGAGALATALAVQAAALWRDRLGLPSAFAAGACAAAAAAAHPATGVLALPLAVLGIGTRPSEPPGRASAAGPVRARARLGAGTAFVLALPLVLRMRRLEAPDAAPLAALAVVAVIAHAAGRGALRRPSLRAGVAALLAAAAVGGGVETLRASPALVAGELAALDWVRAHTRLLDVVCAHEQPASAWIPAVTGRATTAPVAPGWPTGHGPCAVSIAFSSRAAPPAIPEGAIAFRSAHSVVWTNDGKR